ncbi:MAG: sigma-70 family RNA polymerase sigma factor [Ruminococcaceae bacterium]|nr:sigma-70 family RNA polymerase sigma factor [Oscillospiraceae bacterium]
MTRERAAELVAENMKTIYAWALSRVSDKADAEDLAGDVMVAVIENAHRLRCDDAFFGWFWQIARNTYASFLNKRAKETTVDCDSIPEIADAETPEETTVCKETTSALYRELALLAKHHRNCSVDYYFNGLSVKEIAEKYSITSENVKYYLFKTRKILKEGIAMERQFGEKSFNPTPFELQVFFCGTMTEEYLKLFKERKLPGQILSAAYYTPMSISELCLELGVPTVYLEDEIHILSEYGFLKKKGDKYQTQIILTDDGFYSEVWEKCKKEYRSEAAKISKGLSEKLDSIRDIGFIGNDLDGDLLLWDALVISLAEAYQRVPAAELSHKINRDTVGFCYGRACDKNNMPDVKRTAWALANTNNREDGQITLFLLFSKNNEYTYKGAYHADEYVNGIVDAYREDHGKTEIPAIYPEEKEKLMELIKDEVDNVEKLIRLCNGVCTESLRSRAPESLEVDEGRSLLATLMFTMSMIATLCEDEGLRYPEEGHPGIIALN